MTERKKNDEQPEHQPPEGGRAAERLRQFERARGQVEPGLPKPGTPSDTTTGAANSKDGAAVPETPTQ